MVVLAVSGITAGALVFNEVHGTAWSMALARCDVLVGPRPSGALSAQVDWAYRLRACNAPAEELRVAGRVAGGVAVVALGVVLTWWLPRRMMRRLGSFGAPPSGWPTPGPPVLLGPGSLLVPFTVRYRGEPHIVMPRGARRRTAPEIAAVLAHERAHVRAGDVRLVWLTQGLRTALPLVAAVPVVATAVAVLADPDRSVSAAVGAPLWWDYAARVGLLALAARLLAARIHRAREHEADAAAVAEGAGPGLTAVLVQAVEDSAASAGDGGTGRAVLSARLVARWRAVRERMAGLHPTPGRRLDHLADPTGHPVTGRLDEAIAGMLAGTVLVTSHQLTVVLPLPQGPDAWLPAVDALLAGLLIALACGPTWWHREPPDPGEPRWRRAAHFLALPSAIPVGLYFEVGQVGVSGAPYGTWWTALTVPAAVAAATVLCVTLARSRWRPDRERGWLVPTVVTTLVFGSAFWIGTTAATTVAAFGPRGALLVLSAQAWVSPVAVLSLLGCLAAWRYRAPSQWLPWQVLAVSATAAGLTVGAVRLTTSTPAEAGGPGRSQMLDLWSVGSAGLALLAAVLLLGGADAIPDAVRWAPPATLLAGGVIYLRWSGEWADPAGTAVRFLTEPTALLAAAALLPMALMPLPAPPVRLSGRAVRYVLPVLTAGLAAGTTRLLLTSAGSLAYELSGLVRRGG